MHKLFGVRVFKVAADTYLSCPNRDGKKGVGGCTFCDDVGSSSRTQKKATVREQILNNINFRGNQKGKPKKFIVHFQSFTNTYADIAILKNLYDQTIDLHQDIVGISISTRSDALDFEKLKLIDSYRKIFPYVCIEIGMQSIYDKTLNFYNRQETHNDFLNAYNMITTHFPLLDVALHVILGSCTETYEDIMNMASYLNKELNVKGVKLHLLAVLKKTKLHEIYNNNAIVEADIDNADRGKAVKDYDLISTSEKAVQLIANFIKRLPANCVIHRLAGHGNAHQIVYPSWLVEEKDRLALRVKQYLEIN
ncbi:MAG: TIGR01212 family radical SAM protein [Oligoflexia bacterium]|nr:TIGR01212 family radical SAM protein [Oligoflexia bacterium]